MNDQPQPQPAHLTVFTPIADGNTTCDNGDTHHQLTNVTELPANALPDGTSVTTCVHGHWVLALEDGE